MSLTWRNIFAATRPRIFNEKEAAEIFLEGSTHFSHATLPALLNADFRLFLKGRCDGFFLFVKGRRLT